MAFAMDARGDGVGPLSAETCTALSGNTELLYDLGNVVQRAAAILPITDEGWKEAALLEANPLEAGARIVLTGSGGDWAQLAYCEATLVGRGPSYGEAPSSFLRWLACQDVGADAPTLAQTLGLRTDEDELFLVLEFLVVKAAG